MAQAAEQESLFRHALALPANGREYVRPRTSTRPRYCAGVGGGARANAGAWGSGADQNFTINVVDPSAVPGPVIGTGLTQLLHFLVYSAGAGRGRHGRGVSDLTHPEATDWRALDPTDAFGPYYRIIAPNNFVCSLCVCKTQNKFARRFKI